MTRGFSESGVRLCGGGGDVGCDEYSVIRIWVMYVSITSDTSAVSHQRSSLEAANPFQRPGSEAGGQLWKLLTGAVGILFAEAAVDDATFLVFESLSAAWGHTRASPVCAVHSGAVLRS